MTDENEMIQIHGKCLCTDPNIPGDTEWEYDMKGNVALFCVNCKKVAKIVPLDDAPGTIAKQIRETLGSISDIPPQNIENIGGFEGGESQ